MKKITKLIAGVLAAAMVLGACGSKPAQDKETANGTATQTEAGNSENSGEVKKLKVALILPGKKDDVSFNQAMYEGVTAYTEAHPEELELKVVENVYEVADIEPTDGFRRPGL